MFVQRSAALSTTLALSPRSRRLLVLAAAVCLGMTGCATVPGDSRTRLIDIPLAAAHGDIAFSVTTGTRHGPACTQGEDCPPSAASAATIRFAGQVQRLAGILQKGARALYPDLEQRVPRLAGGGFDIHVVDGDGPGSASSPNGRVALNSALGVQRPYDDWVAFVIAREMGHVIARHHEENSLAGIATSALMNIILPGSGVLKLLISAGGSALAAKSQHEAQTLAADAIARDLLVASGLRLRDISLTLLIEPVLLDEGKWSNDFRRSADNFVSHVHTAELAETNTLARQALHQAGRTMIAAGPCQKSALAARRAKSKSAPSYVC